MQIKGLTLLEGLVVLFLLSILITIAFLNTRRLNDPLRNTHAQTQSFFKQVRAKAMATTSGYRIRLEGNTLYAEYANNCRASRFTPDPQLRLTATEGVSLQLIPNPICYTSRGLLHLFSNQSSPAVVLRDNRSRERRIVLFVGGAVQ